MHNNDLTIPNTWRQRLSKATTLPEVATLFNEAEQYDDFDCCAELDIWCKGHPSKRAGIDKPIYIFAETDTEQLVYRDSEREWKLEKKIESYDVQTK